MRRARLQGGAVQPPTIPAHRPLERHASPRRAISKPAPRRRDKTDAAVPSRHTACCARHDAEPHRGCGEASAVATSVKVRNQKALKRHITRSQQPRHTAHEAPSEHSVASRLGRCDQRCEHNLP